MTDDPYDFEALEAEAQQENDDEAAFADKFGLQTDPLAEFEQRFIEEEYDDGRDPIRTWITKKIMPSDDLVRETKQSYVRSARYWRNFMETQGRHPACANADHVVGFCRWLADEKECGDQAVSEHLSRIRVAYKYFGVRTAYPHPSPGRFDEDSGELVDGWNPIDEALTELSFTITEPDKQVRVTEEDLREKFAEITHISERAMIALAFKLGLRRSEITNIKIAEVNLSFENSAIQEYYPELGTHHEVSDRPNSVHIPESRELNKSKNARTLPLDDEMASMLYHYLIFRPTTGEEYVFRTGRGEKMDSTNVNRIWERHWTEEKWANPEGDYRRVTTHSGRHFLTTFLENHEWDKRHIAYMRGDKMKKGEGFAARSQADSQDVYIHTYYEDIEELYRADIFKIEPHRY